MLRKPISIFLAAIIALSATAISAAGAPPGVVQEDYKKIMPLSQVRGGMKGYGLTVFRGTKIERFDVEIISILRKINNGKDLILARMSGGPITARQANIMQGMSGSPVYINGKIIGAVAYGPGSFSKEPLCMLTPIEDMLDALDPKMPKQPLGLSSVSSTMETPVNTGTSTFNRIEIRDRSHTGAAPQDTLVMTPLMTPLMVSGISSRGISQLTELLEPYGIIPMAGPGAQTQAIPVELKPGSAFGLSLVTGDIDMTAVGTLTYRRGNMVIGFGHPMLNIGPIDAPLSTAYVHDVFPSYQVSTKLASPMKIVGRIFADRPWSVGGEIGGTSKMIPLTISIDDTAIGRKRTVRANVINHPLIAPRLVLIASAEALTQTHGIPSDAMASVRLEIEADQVGKIVRDNRFFDPASIETAALDDMQNLLNILSNNRFHPVDVKSVKMFVKIEPGRKTAAVERVFVDKSNYEPGETVTVGVKLRPYKSEKITKYIDLKLPETAPDGRMTLQVGGGALGSGDGGQMMVMTAGGAPVAPRISPMPSGASVENIRQLVDKYLERDRNNDLVAKVVLPGSSVSIAGEKLSNLPDAIANVMKSPKSSATRLEREEVKAVQPTDYIIMGAQSVSIRVERRQLGEKKQPSQPSGSSEPQMGTPPPPPPAEEVESEMGNEQMGFAAIMPISLAAAPVVAVEEEVAESPAEAAPAPDEATKPAAEAKPESKPAQKPAEKSIVRQPTVWKQSSFKEFSIGTFNGTTASFSDDIRVTPALSKLSGLPETQVWVVVPDGQGGVYAGTGNDGLIYRIDEDGKSSVYSKTGELQVHSLLRGPDGTLYAGTSPNGKVYRIDADGEGNVLFDAAEKYILALVMDTKGNLYAGVGDSGTIYRITPDGSATEFAKLKDASVLSLAVDKGDNIYAGTAKRGVVYKIAQDGKISPLYSAAEDSIASVAVDGSGNVYAGTGVGKGNVYKISPTGSTATVFDKAPRALSMAVDASDNIYIVSDEQIFVIAPDETVTTLDNRRSGAQFIAVAVDSDGTIFAGAANPGAVYRAQSRGIGTYESPVRDATVPSRWGAINWVADVPTGASVLLQTRTGNTAEPDATWSQWSPGHAPGQTVMSPPARYIQYKATLSASQADSPALKQVTIAYLTENRPPKVTIKDPLPGAVISRTQTIKWTGVDPDKDTLKYDLYYSADAGKTWQPLSNGSKQTKTAVPPPPEKAKQAEPVKPEEKTKSEPVPEGKPDAAELMAQLKAELDGRSDIPDEVRERILEEAPAAIEKSVEAISSPTDDPSNDGEPASGSESTTQTSRNWDTTKVNDGTYMIKVVASDRISNATGYLTDEQVTGPVIVANTPPRITADKNLLKVNPNSSVSLDGQASSSLVPIAGVQFKVDSGDWMAAAASDGIFDSVAESFIVETQPIAKGKHTIEIKAIDAAGNAASTKVTATVP